jgi:poly(3-hydroxybutyrate) depolymerase
MRLNFRKTTAIAFVGLAAWLALSLVHTPAFAQQPAGGAGGPQAGAQAGGRGGRGGGLGQATDPRVQNRTYHFADTNEELPYCLFVSSKVSRDKKNPLIVSLHGLGIGPGFMCRGKALDLAEEGGYILVAPMGYNVGGWYGSPVMNLGAGRGRGGAQGAGAAPAPAQGAAPAAGRGAAPAAPANLAELSEKDVMNVLAMMRKEFNVDDNRTYLMGHSMGGAGTYFLGAKHAKEWAAIAPIAPAAFLMNNNRADILKGIKSAGVPMLVTQGDADEAVPVTNTRMWVETMKEMTMKYEYKEYPGVTHGPIIEAAMPDIFAFFAKYTKAGR